MRELSGCPKNGPFFDSPTKPTRPGIGQAPTLLGNQQGHFPAPDPLGPSNPHEPTNKLQESTGR
jgi:hypothetical protein